MKLKPFLTRLLVPTVCATVTIVVIFCNSIREVAGRTDLAEVFGPNVGLVSVSIILAVAIGGVAWLRGTTRIAAVIIWLLLLAVLSQRFVQEPDDAVFGNWLLVKTQVRPFKEADNYPVRCDIGPIAAMCYTHAGVRTRYITVLPLSRMIEVPSPVGPVLTPSR